MGQALAERFPVCAATFAEADAALGERLSDLIFAGPAERLTLTENAQPAILTMSVAVLRLLAELDARGTGPCPAWRSGRAPSCPHPHRAAR